MANDGLPGRALGDADGAQQRAQIADVARCVFVDQTDVGQRPLAETPIEVAAEKASAVFSITRAMSPASGQSRSLKLRCQVILDGLDAFDRGLGRYESVGFSFIFVLSSTVRLRRAGNTCPMSRFRR